MKVAAERSGWRDEEISRRHRLYGWDCPAIDVDFLMLEYDTGEPVALVEYKHERAGQPKIGHPSYQAIKVLAERAGLPFLVVRYWPGMWAYSVFDVTGNTEWIDMTEQEYVSHLYRLRSRRAGTAVLRDLNDLKPPERVTSLGRWSGS